LENIGCNHRRNYVKRKYVRPHELRFK